ncbi:MAG: thioredoxin family protein [Spirochaetales bacterium]|nr:thioredoxin family protein [Spirochaetales bacterium]
MLRNPILIALSVFFFTATCKEPQISEIQWKDSIEDAVALALKEDKMIMIDVYTDWCTWCKELDEKTYVHPDVIKESASLVSIKINPETDGVEKTEFIAPFSVTGYPTILFVSGEGRLYGRIGGFAEGPEFATRMTAILENKDKIDDLISRHGSGDVEASLELLENYETLGVKQDAINVILDLKAKGLLPAEPDYYISLGYYYFDKENYTDAISNFDYIFTDLKPLGETYFHTVYMKGYSMFLSGEKASALKLLNDQVKLEENEFKSQFSDLIAFLKNAESGVVE